MTAFTGRYLEVLALGPAELLQVEVEHGGEPVDQLRAQERLLDVHRQVLQHVHRLSVNIRQLYHSSAENDAP